MRVPLVLGVLLLAGCLDGASPTDGGFVSGTTSAGQAPPATTAAMPAPDAETGSIAVSVTTSEIQPVEQAQVVLDGTDFAAFTDASGLATFNQLEPGKYTILVAKPGYKSQFEKGKLVDVVANEVVEVKIILDPELVLTPSESYYRSLVFNGLIACSFMGAPGTVGYTSYCSRGVTVAGIELRDPNENSTHPWEVENIQVQSIVIEARWQASNGLNGRDLHMGVFRSYGCTDPALGQAKTCNPNSDMLNTFGPSPMYGVRHETANNNLTKYLGKEPEKYPSKVFTAVRAYCGAGCSPAAVHVQQKYEAWATTFYGAEAPPDWSVYKTSG